MYSGLQIMAKAHMAFGQEIKIANLLLVLHKNHSFTLKCQNKQYMLLLPEWPHVLNKIHKLTNIPSQVVPVYSPKQSQKASPVLVSTRQVLFPHAKLLHGETVK